MNKNEIAVVIDSAVKREKIISFPFTRMKEIALQGENSYKNYVLYFDTNTKAFVYSSIAYFKEKEEGEEISLSKFIFEVYKIFQMTPPESEKNFLVFCTKKEKIKSIKEV